MPSLNFTLATSFGNMFCPSRRRHVFCAPSTSLNTMASAVLFDKQPFERIFDDGRSRTCFRWDLWSVNVSSARRENHRMPAIRRDLFGGQATALSYLTP
jgi:hypothetical protein